MTLLAGEITRAIVLECGTAGFLERLSEPTWFQALGCVLGFDWHSSGLTTTTTCGAIKEGIYGSEEELGLFAAGGKGAASRKTPAEITVSGEHTGIDADPLIYAILHRGEGGQRRGAGWLSDLPPRLLLRCRE